MHWNWFQKNPTPARTVADRNDSIPELTQQLNEKYGDYEYAKDARALDTSGLFASTLSQLAKKTYKEGARSVLIAGANSGAEVPFFDGFEVTALDLSDVALKKLSGAYPQARIVQGDIEHLPFDDKSFDVYVCLRAIHASNLDLQKALEESVRVTRSFLIYSVWNGYNIEGGLVKGMYDYTTQGIEPSLAIERLEAVKHFLTARGYVQEVFEVPSEFLIFAAMPS